MKVKGASDVGLLVMRLIVGLVAAYFGAQKAFGAFGGMGLHGTVSMFEDKMKIPPIFALLATAGELMGGLGIASGLFTRVAAFGLACTMAVATYENWNRPGLIHSVFAGGGAPTDPAQAFFSFVLFGAAVGILLIGPGSLSLDEILWKGKKKASRK